MRALTILLLLGLSLGARAQVAPPTVPQLPDEPLPEWHPPVKRAQVLFLNLTPQMQDAQRLRQLGLWISTVGWIELFGAGVLYVWAVNVNRDIGSPTPDNAGAVFQPQVEDQRNQIEASAAVFFSVGAVMTAGGFVLYTMGQWRMTVHHKQHPRDPLPPLSGL
jgi:hypothetical protein